MQPGGGAAPAIPVGAPLPGYTGSEWFRFRPGLAAATRVAWLEATAVLAAWLVAAATRAPYLWTVPRLTDETQQLLYSLQAWRTGDLLTPNPAVSYIGTVHDVIFAVAFTLFGPSPYVPRLVTALIAATTVPLVYVLARDLAPFPGRRIIDTPFLAPRIGGLVAAGLLATAGAHVIITSHVARSNSFTPVFALAGLLAVERALSGRDGRCLVGAGALFGLALQTHPSTVALFPGVALVVLWQGRSLLRTRWAPLSLAAFLLAYANMLLSIVQTGLAPIHSAQSLVFTHDGGQRPTLDLYLANLGAELFSLWRMLAGQLVARGEPETYLWDPLALPYVGLPLLGLAILALRGRPLLPVTALTYLLILPYFNARYGPILSGRYLMPIVLVGFVAAGVAVSAAVPLLAGRARAWRLAGAGLVAALMLFPLAGLYLYYAEVTASGRTGAAFLRATEVVLDERMLGETVLLDEDLARVKLGAGGHALEAWRYLLAASGAGTRVIRATPKALEVETRDLRPLVILSRERARKVRAPVRLRPILDEWITPGEGKSGAIGIFRAERGFAHRK